MSLADVKDVLKYPQQLYKTYVFDMDGTIYLGEGLLRGAKRMINALNELGIPVRYLSNNPTKDPDDYVKKLERLGLPTPVENISNTVVTTTRWLLENHPDKTVFCVSEEPLKKSLRKAGIKMSENPEEIDIVIASYDRTFDYRKLQIAFDAIWFHKRAFLIQTNPDHFCPFPGGRGEPDCAAITAAIEQCTYTKSQANMGKPDPIMLRETLHGLDVTTAECMMVGDRYHTDIMMGINTGMQTGLVLTGETTAADVRELAEDKKPTYVMDRVDRLIPQYLWDEFGWTEDND